MYSTDKCMACKLMNNGRLYLLKVLSIGTSSTASSKAINLGSLSLSPTSVFHNGLYKPKYVLSLRR